MQVVPKLEIHYGKKVPTRQERLNQIANASDIYLTYNWDSYGRLMAATIELHGKLAAVPSLKNSKPIGQNFMSKRARDYLSVIDKMFGEAQAKISRKHDLTKLYSFEDDPIFALVVFGKRNRAFDTDNGVSTLKDWLEPASKTVGQRIKRKRGWGCGLVNNDTQVTAFPVHAKDLGADTPITTIYLRRWETVREPITQVWARAIMEG